jgi:DNA topoisomerase-1
MDLIVLESPNKVRDVQRYAAALGFQVKVTATVGHLLDLPPMSEGPAIDTRTFALDRLQPRDGAAAERVTRLRAAFAEAARVIVATDPDREGEAIAAEVWQWIPKHKAWRATFEEITPAGVETGLGAMRRALNAAAVDAALTRRIIDRLAGWHGTDVVFQKLRQHRGLSAGRLQSAALRLVVERYRDHQSFRGVSTFGVQVKLRADSGAEFFARLLGVDGSVRTFATRAEAEAFQPPAKLTVAAVDARRKEQRPRPPFEASSWLQVACKALGISVKDATHATQALFESGQTTYPRTDTVRVGDDAIAWARRELEQRFGASYVPAKPWVHKDGGTSAVQGAHEAIRPTIPHGPTGELAGRRDGQWGRAYVLIEGRFLASQAAARVVEATTAHLQGEGATFLARGQVEIFDGWRRVITTDAEEEVAGSPSSKDAAVAHDDENDDGSLPPLVAGTELDVVSVEITTHTTKPKPLFTQPALVAELKRLGIGRPSTYHTVVPLLLGRGWATEQAPAAGEKRSKKTEQLGVIVPVQVGFDLSDFLCQAFPGLVDYDFTASMEAALDEIEAGKRNRLDVASTWWARFEPELVTARGLKAQQPERKDLGPCPKCSAEGRTGRLRLIQGVSADTKKAYEFAGCDADTKEARVCGQKAQVHKGQLIPAVRCPRCQSPLRAVNRKDGGHSWKCEQDGWFLAGKKWELVSAPICPRCSSPMTHRERTDPKGEYFWACFPDKVFLDSDRFGGVDQRRRRSGKP